NTTEIHPEVHSTDTHGTNEVNFALLHVFGYQFAPRYRDIQTKVREALYGFKHPTQYGDVLLKPLRKINARLIVEEWEQMQRIFVSLARKTTTQSINQWCCRLQTNNYNSTCWPYCHGHALPPRWLKACNPARNGGAHDHHGFYHGV